MPDEIVQDEDPKSALAKKLLNDLVDVNYKAIASGEDISTPEGKQKIGDQKRALIRNFIGEMIQLSATGDIPSAADNIFKEMMAAVTKDPETVRGMVDDVINALKEIQAAADAEINEFSQKYGGN